ncbi:MAG TPA: MFS transporter [Edaphocola sp.]|nr:MFS transporter [Edaphocola sp.]
MIKGITNNPAQKKRQQRAWAFYDWANSAYNLVITSTIFPIYYIAITRNPENGDKVSFFGWEIINSSLLNYGLSFAYLIIAVLSPILSSIADNKGNKKKYMQFFTIMGSMACMGLFFFKKDSLELGIILSVIAAIGYCGSLVFYNSYLPEIASKEEQDGLSARGFSYGYIGSVICQILCLLFVFNYDNWFGQVESWGPRFSFLFVGFWWLAWAMIPFSILPRNNLNRPDNSNAKVNVFKSSFGILKEVAKKIGNLPKMKTYLIAFFFYSMGVQTVMLAAAVFGSKVVKKQVEGKWVNMEAEDLIPIILLIQVVAILGALLMAKLSQKIGNISVLMLNVCVWILICLLAYYTYSNYQFIGLAILVGLVMGGIQSMSRSTFSKMIPLNTLDNTSFFSFYDVIEKLSIVLGMFSFAFIEQVTGNMRIAIIGLAIYFILGLSMLLWTNRLTS